MEPHFKLSKSIITTLNIRVDLLSGDEMTVNTDELLRAVNELKLEVQRIREVVDILLNVVIEGEMDEDPSLEIYLNHLKDNDPFSIYN
jgi:hypothetical protein